MSEFIGEPGSVVRVRLDEHEADVLRNLLLEMETMLDSGPATDPVMERLFPRAYTTEPDESSYRELIGGELESAKKKALGSVRESIGESGPVDIPLARSQADDWLAAMNDIRLAIGTRLDVTEETMGRELDPEDPQAPALALLHWLGWMQEEILERLTQTQETE